MPSDLYREKEKKGQGRRKVSWGAADPAEHDKGKGGEPQKGRRTDSTLRHRDGERRRPKRGKKVRPTTMLEMRRGRRAKGPRRGPHRYPKRMTRPKKIFTGALRGKGLQTQQRREREIRQPGEGYRGKKNRAYRKKEGLSPSGKGCLPEEKKGGGVGLRDSVWAA